MEVVNRNGFNSGLWNNNNIYLKSISKKYTSSVDLLFYTQYYYRFIVRFPIGWAFLFLHHEEFWNRVLRPDGLPGVEHMCGMQYKIVLNITFWPEPNKYSYTNLCA